jgi:hypothetical protein
MNYLSAPTAIAAFTSSIRSGAGHVPSQLVQFPFRSGLLRHTAVPAVMSHGAWSLMCHPDTPVLRHTSSFPCGSVAR